MPTITVVVPHALGQDTAAARLRDFTRQLREKHEAEVSDVAEEWTENMLTYRFKALGMRFHGTGQVTSADARLTVEAPLAVVLFKGRIEQEIRQTLTSVLNS